MFLVLTDCSQDMNRSLILSFVVLCVVISRLLKTAPLQGHLAAQQLLEEALQIRFPDPLTQHGNSSARSVSNGRDEQRRRTT